MPGRKVTPVTFCFELDIPGVLPGYFPECSGLGLEHEVIEMSEVNDQSQRAIKIPSRLKREKITLKRGITRPGSLTMAQENG